MVAPPRVRERWTYRVHAERLSDNAVAKGRGRVIGKRIIRVRCTPTNSMPPYLPDLQVVALNYVVEHGDGISYNSPPPIEFETSACRYRLADGKLRCELIQHFADVGAAREAAEPVLRAWEVSSDIRGRTGDLRFRFDSPEVIDRNPPEPGSIRGLAMIALPGAFVTASGMVSFHVTKRAYPEPPTDFAVNPNVDTLARRYDGYRSGREPLQGMAYFALTVVESMGGGRKSAAKRLGVDEAVLRKIGELSSTRGDVESARKAGNALLPLTGEERAWLEAAVRELILRVGDTRPAAARPVLSMGGLPPLHSGT